MGWGGGHGRECAALIFGKMFWAAVFVSDYTAATSVANPLLKVLISAPILVVEGRVCEVARVSGEVAKTWPSHLILRQYCKGLV